MKVRALLQLLKKDGWEIDRTRGSHRQLRNQWGNLLNIQNYTGGIAYTWTLAVEEHAYLLLVLILAIAARRGARVRQVFLLLASLAGAVLFNRIIETRFGINTFTHTDTRVDGILYGVLLVILYHFAPERLAKLQRLWPLWTAVLVLTLIYLRFTPHTLHGPSGPYCKRLQNDRFR